MAYYKILEDRKTKQLYFVEVEDKTILWGKLLDADLIAKSMTVKKK